MLLIQKLLAIAQVAGSVVLYLLLGLSVLSIGTILERWWFFRLRRVDVDQLGRLFIHEFYLFRPGSRVARPGGARCAVLSQSAAGLAS